MKSSRDRCPELAVCRFKSSVNKIFPSCFVVTEDMFLSFLLVLVPLFWIWISGVKSGLPFLHCRGKCNVRSLRFTSGAIHCQPLVGGDLRHSWFTGLLSRYELNWDAFIIIKTTKGESFRDQSRRSKVKAQIGDKPLDFLLVICVFCYSYRDNRFRAHRPMSRMSTKMTIVLYPTGVLLRSSIIK